MNSYLVLFIDAYKELFHQLDSDNDGMITFAEFQQYLSKNGIDKDEPFVKEIFISLDVNKDGKLTIEGDI